MTGDASFLLAAAGGAISFLSPCVLPLVPAYLCFIAGTSLDQLSTNNGTAKVEARRIFLSSIFFVLGFTVVFTLLGASASALNRLILTYLDIISKVAGAIIVVFGLHYTGLLRIAFLNREARFNPNRIGGSIIGAFIIGLAFAFGWTPCIGPILATILTVAATDERLGFGISLLFVYSLGLGIPFLIAAAAINPFIGFMRRFRQHLHKVEIGAGVLLIVTGILIFTGGLGQLGYFLLEIFPSLARFG